MTLFGHPDGPSTPPAQSKIAMSPLHEPMERVESSTYEEASHGELSASPVENSRKTSL